MGTVGKLVVWTLLVLPGLFMVAGLAREDTLVMDFYHPSGETAVRLMVLALLPGPLSEFFGSNALVRFWLGIRRYLGLAAFAYALLHLVIYVIDMRLVSAMVDELPIPSIWTGWLALMLMVPPALISSDAAMRVLRRNWGRIQRLVYLAFAAGIVHWLLLGWDWRPVAVHAVPLCVAWMLRLIARNRSKLERTTL